jgi:hypothetical protein
MTPLDVSNTLALQVTRVSWKNAFSRLAVTMEHTKNRYSILKSRRLVTGIRPGSNGPRGSLLIPRDFSNSSLYTPTSTLTQDVSAQLLDQTLPLPSSAPVELECVNCTTTGTVGLKYGHFELVQHSYELEDAISSAFMEFDVNNFLAHIALSATPKATDKWAVDLWKHSLVHAQLTDALSFDVDLEYQLFGSIQFSGGIQLDFGFQVVVPDGSSVHMNLGSPSQSSANGL